MLRPIYLLLSIILLQSCTSSKFEDNRSKLDGIYGECDNPIRSLTRRQYKECKAAEKANGSFFDLKGFNLTGGNQSIIYQYNINPFLWNAALETTSSYPLKIADNSGGFIETDWIYDSNSEIDRCLIKVRVLTQELVSNGIKTNLICEKKINNAWAANTDSFEEEEKQITLKILQLASELSQTTL